MSQSGYTPILSYSSATASAVPLAANLSQGELAVNTNDGKLFYKDSAGVVQTMASKATGSIGGSTTQVQFNNAGVLGGSASLTWSGTVLTSSGFAGPLNGTVGATTPAAGSFTTTTIGTSETLSYGTANGVTYLNGSKVLTSGSALTYDGTTFAAPLTSLSGNGIVLTVDRTGTGGNDRTNVQFSNAGTVRGGIGTVGASDGIYFNYGTTEGMRLTSTGLGIGTSSPAAKLDVQTSGVGIQLKQNSTGSATYYVMDNTVETGGKRWRFGYTGGAGIPCFSLYNQTDNVLSLVADASGNLGLGVTPSAWGGSYKALQNPAGSLSAYSTSQLGLNLNTYDTGVGTFTYVNTAAASRYLQLNGQHQWYSAASGTAGNLITFTQAMTLDASGNLGIGTSSPANKLQVAGAVVATGAAASYAAGMTIIDYASGNSNITAIGPNTSTVGTTVFQSFSSNASLGGERMRIDSSGNLLVGISTYATTPAAGVTVQTGNNASVNIGHTNSSSGFLFVNFGYNSGQIGSITQSGTTAVLYNVTSDQRLKENIVDAPEFGSVIDSIKVRSYDWKADGNHQRAGFIAQELVTVAPEAVHQPADEEEMMAVDYSKLVPMLVKEIQSLRKRLADAGI